MFSLIGVCYYLFVVPLRIGFPFGDTSFDDSGLGFQQHYLYTIVVDELWDLFFLVDMLLRFKYFAVKDPDSGENDMDSSGGVYLTDPDDIRYTYRQSGAFFLDMAASLPFDLLALAVSVRLFLWLR